MVTSEALILPQGCRGSSGGHGTRRGEEEGGGAGEGVSEGGEAGRGRRRTCVEEQRRDDGLISAPSTTSTPGAEDGQSCVPDMLGERKRERGRPSVGGVGTAVTASGASPDAATASSRDEASARAERMARYKEERRKQLASQFGGAAAGVAVSSSSSNEDGLRVRTTRTSRLRAAAVAAAANSSGGGSPNENGRRENWRSHRAGAGSSAVASPRGGSTGVPEKGVSSSDPHNNDSRNEGCAVVQQQHGSNQQHQHPILFSSSSSASSLADVNRREKDKSGKRKSNLNRALNVEEVPQGVADPCDDGSAGCRRRRRVVSAYLEGASPRRRSPEPTSRSVADLSYCRVNPHEVPGGAVRKTSMDTGYNNHRNSDNWTLRQMDMTSKSSTESYYREVGSSGLGYRKMPSTEPSSAQQAVVSSPLKSQFEGNRAVISPIHQNSTGAITQEQRKAFNLVQSKAGEAIPTSTTTTTTPQIGVSHGPPISSLRGYNGCSRPVEKTNGSLVPVSTRPSSATYLRRTPESTSNSNGNNSSGGRAERSSPATNNASSGVTMRRKPITATVTARRSSRPASYCSGVTHNPEELMSRAPLKRAQSGGSFGMDSGRGERPTPVHLRSARSVEGNVGGGGAEQRVVSIEEIPSVKECIIEEAAVAEESGEVPVCPPSALNGRDALKERNHSASPSPPPLVFSQHKTPSSILKRRTGSGDDAASSSGSGSSSPSRPPPVSILKRKATDEAMVMVSANHSAVLGRATPPLTSEHAPQGILKKRPSLDESEPRRSHSPLELDHGTEFRPILKQPARPERRLSLEESSGNAAASTTTGILKQSRGGHGGRTDEEDHLPTSPSFVPGGLVSRVPGIPPPFEVIQEPRPILKRRSGSEEASEGSGGVGGVGGVGATEVPPRPILKRRAGSEEEAGHHHAASSDERPPHPRPILKSSSSTASSSSSTSSSSASSRLAFPPLQRRSLDEATCDLRWRPAAAFDSEEDRIFRRSGMPRRQRSEERPPGILRLRDSSDSLWGTSVDVATQDAGRSVEASSGVCGGAPPYARGRRSDSAPPGDCIARTTGSRPHTPPPSLVWLEDAVADDEGALDVERTSPVASASRHETSPEAERPKGGRVAAIREPSRFRTQPVTSGELRELARLETVKAYRGSVTAPLLQFGEVGGESIVGGGRSLTRRLSEAWEKGVLRLRRGGDSPAPLPVHPETSPSPSAGTPTILESPKQPETISQSATVSSAIEDIREEEAKGSVKVQGEEGQMSIVHSREVSSEQVGERSSGGSVSARALLFSQMAEESKASVPKAMSRVDRFRDRKDRRSCGGRFSTQPITSEEVTEATRQAESGGSGTELDENDPSKLSLAERVRLFNQKILDERLPSNSSDSATSASNRRRSLNRRLNHMGSSGDSRFRTQPITTEELREAMVVTPQVAHSMSTTETRSTTGTSSPVYGNATDSKSTNVVVVVKGSDNETRRKGILKNSREASQESAVTEGKVGSSDSEGGETVRSILKVNLSMPPCESSTNDSVRNVILSESALPHKGVLKKETSTTNGGSHEPRVRSILKPESEWSERRNSSSGSSTATESSESSSEESESSEEEEEEEEEEVVVEGRGEQGRSQDIASILRGVEKEARLRQRLSEGEGGGVSSEDGEMEAGGGGGGSSSSSGGREVRCIIRNEAVARRRQAGIIRNQQQQMKEEIKNAGAAGVATIVTPLIKSRSAVSVGVLPSIPPGVRAPKSQGSSPFGGGRRGLPPFVGGERAFLDPVAALAAATTHPLGGGLVPCQRSRTQPIPGRLPGTDGGDRTPEECALVGGSIAERLAALQKSGQSDWRKRISRLNPEEELTEVTQGCNGSTPTGRLRSKSERAGVDCNEEEECGSSSPKGLLAERKGKLVEAAEGWRHRVEPSDALGFSVAGRMGKASPVDPQSTAPPASPPSSRRTKKTVRPTRFRSKTTTNLASEAASSGALLSPPNTPDFGYSLKRSISAPGCEDGELVQGLAGACKVGVPRADDETFMDFFKGVSAEKAWEEHLDLEVDDFDCLTSQSRELLVQKRTIKKQQRRLATSRNPIRALAARSDLKEEYLEIKSTGVAEREIRRMRVEKLSVNSNLAVEALAGLASKEDFTAVSLRKANALPISSSMLPYKHPMLLLVKGRRHVQTRLVEPVAKSVNHGDAYVLVMQDEVYNWVGDYSNVIERSRSAEIAAMVQQKKDLGCSGVSQVITIGGGMPGAVVKPGCTLSQVAKFWKILGSDDGSSLASEAGDPDEDELYEASIVDTNMAYEVKGEELVPLEEYWGCIPRIQVLDPSKVLVFDFGSELYVWNGKNAPTALKKLGAKLIKELWEDGCDYSVCDVSPLEPFQLNPSANGDSDMSKEKKPRPDWALLGKVNQHMETVLFREKFLDWPDFSRVIKVKGSDEEEELKGGKAGANSIEVHPCSAKEMLEAEGSTADLELEGSHLGRGDCYADEEGLRMHEISTIGVTVWHISEFEHEEVIPESVGQFHSGGTYVIRWHYRVTTSGRELSGGKSKHAVVGRERCAYFCWQGQGASLNEKGAAALLTVELDKEKGPQVRLTQGAEPPAFLRIFKGRMVVHRGRRGERKDNDSVAFLGSSTKSDYSKRTGWRLYICRSAFEEAEAVLEEVQCGARHLRSRASFLLIHVASGIAYLWHGAKCHQKTRKIALVAVNNLKEHLPPEFAFPSGVSLTVTELEEGSEPKVFFDALGGGSRQLYSSLLGSTMSYEDTPRLFHLSSISSGTFSATEVLGPWRCGSLRPGGVQSSEMLAPQPFPFLQSELYSASQPTLFLLDNHHEIWLWQGWWPEEDSPGDSGGEEENRVLGDGHIRGSSAIRWQAERRAAMQTTLDYVTLKAECIKGLKPRAWLVWAGLEPLAFTNLFPEWTDRDDVAEINIREGKGGESLPVEQELARLTRSTYPGAQLLQRPLPDGVDPTRLELYLSPQHFQELLGMTREDFNGLPPWRQTNMKKEVGLF